MEWLWPVVYPVTPGGFLTPIPTLHTGRSKEALSRVVLPKLCREVSLGIDNFHQSHVYIETLFPNTKINQNISHAHFLKRSCSNPPCCPCTGSYLSERDKQELTQRGKQILQDIEKRCWALLDLDSCPHRSPSPLCCTGLGETEPMACKRLTSTGPEQSG